MCPVPYAPFPTFGHPAMTWPILVAAAGTGVAQAVLAFLALDRYRRARACGQLALEERWQEISSVQAPSPWPERLALLSLLFMPMALQAVCATSLHQSTTSTLAWIPEQAIPWASWVDGIFASMSLSIPVLLLAAVALPAAMVYRWQVARYVALANESLEARTVEGSLPYRSPIRDDSHARLLRALPTPRARQWVGAALAGLGLVAAPVLVGMHTAIAGQFEVLPTHSLTEPSVRWEVLSHLAQVRLDVTIWFGVAAVGMLGLLALGARVLLRRAAIRRHLGVRGDSMPELSWPRTLSLAFGGLVLCAVICAGAEPLRKENADPLPLGERGLSFGQVYPGGTWGLNGLDPIEEAPLINLGNKLVDGNPVRTSAEFEEVLVAKRELWAQLSPNESHPGRLLLAAHDSMPNTDLVPSLRAMRAAGFGHVMPLLIEPRTFDRPLLRWDATLTTTAVFELTEQEDPKALDPLAFETYENFVIEVVRRRSAGERVRVRVGAAGR